MDMNAINQNVLVIRQNGFAVSNPYTGHLSRFETREQAEAWVLYLEEDAELGLVPEHVINEIVEMRGDDSILMRWDALQEELACLYEQAREEFGI